MSTGESDVEIQKIAADASLEGSAKVNSQGTNMAKSASLIAATAGVNNGKQLMRDISFKPRFRYNYGFDEKFYDQALRYKDAWQDKLFYVDEEALINEFRSDETSIRQIPHFDVNRLQIGCIEEERITQNQAEQQFSINENPIHLQLCREKKDMESRLQFGESAELRSLDRNGVVLNAGGHVTSISWLPQKFSGGNARYQFFAASIINNSHGVEDTINNTQLSVFYKSVGRETDRVKSGIQIWRYDLSRNKLELYKFILTSAIGTCSHLAWAPIDIGESDDTLGILCGTYSDGRLHVFKIMRNQNESVEFSMLIKSSFQYELKDPRGNREGDIVGITCFDFIGHDKIIVGLSAGSIAEFILPYYDESTESDLSQPSFVQSISETPITSISVADPDKHSYFILINTSGNQSFVVEYENFQQGRIESFPTNTLLRPIYNHKLKIFFLSDAWDSIGYSFVRHPHEKPSSLLKLDGVVSALHLSEVIGHPLSISGTTYGEIHIVNISRKILNGAKATNKLLVPLRLWRLELASDQKTLKLSGDYEIVQTDKSTKINVTPPETVISSLAWNENLEGSSIYTAATISGLIILERLDPKFSN